MSAGCVIGECGRQVLAREMCQKHYERWRKGGDPTTTSRVRSRCTLEGCGRIWFAEGLCRSHHHRLTRFGDGFDRRPIGEAKPLEERFWERIDKNGPIPDHVPHLGECWVWVGAKADKGYGKFIASDLGVKMYAHRATIMVVDGSLPPPGLEVCHRCDNPICVRRSHLFVGTHAENMQDAMAKGRLHPLRGAP